MRFETEAKQYTDPEIRLRCSVNSETLIKFKFRASGRGPARAGEEVLCHGSKYKCTAFAIDMDISSAYILLLLAVESLFRPPQFPFRQERIYYSLADISFRLDPEVFLNFRL